METFLYHLIISETTALFVTTKRIYMIRESVEMADQAIKKSHRSSLKKVSTANILWKEVLFANSKFVIVANIVSLFSKLYEMIGTSLQSILSKEKQIWRYMHRMKDAQQSDIAFGIPESSRCSNWDREIKLSRRISLHQHPRSNLEHFTNILRSFSHTFHVTKDKNLGGADDLLPIIDYIACKSRIKAPCFA